MCTQSLSSGGRGFHARHNSAVLTTAPSNHKWKMGGTRNQRGALTELRAWRAMQARAARHGALLWKASPPSAKIRPLFPSRDGKSGQHAPFSHPMPAIPQQEENVPAFTCPELRCPTRRQLKFHPLYPSDPNLPAPSPRTRSSESRAPCLSPALLAQGQTLQGSPPPSGPSHRRGRSRRPAGQFSTCCRAPSPNFHHRRNARERASHGPPAVGPWAGRLPLPTVSLAVKGSSGKSHAARRGRAGSGESAAGPRASAGEGPAAARPPPRRSRPRPFPAALLGGGALGTPARPASEGPQPRPRPPRAGSAWRSAAPAGAPRPLTSPPQPTGRRRCCCCRRRSDLPLLRPRPRIARRAAALSRDLGGTSRELRICAPAGHGDSASVPGATYSRQRPQRGDSEPKPARPRDSRGAPTSSVSASTWRLPCAVLCGIAPSNGGLLEPNFPALPFPGFTTTVFA